MVARSDLKRLPPAEEGRSDVANVQPPPARAVLVASGIAVAQGMKAGYFWGGLALLGMVGVCFAGRFTSNTVGVRLYSVAFCIALVAAGVVFTILAATSEPDQRGGFLGLAIISYAMAGAAVALIIALERRLRRSQPRAPTDRSSPPARDRE